MFLVMRRVIYLSIISSILTLLITGHAFSVEVKKGGIIQVGVDASPDGWDPHWYTAIRDWQHLEQPYEALIRYNHKMEIVPSLATRWEKPDPLTTIFHLRKGVKFHNGMEMTADDVKFSIDRMKDPKVSARPGYWKTIKSVEVLDKYTIKMTQSEIDVNLMPMMAHNKCSAIVCKEFIEEHGDLKKAVCGTGPFKVKEYVPGDYVVYERHKGYWATGFPRVDRVIFKVIKDETSRLAALRKGSLDIAWFQTPQQVAMAKKEKGLTLVSLPPGRRLIIFIVHTRFPGNNKKLRQAMSAAMDREGMIKVIQGGNAQLTTCIPPTCTPYVLPEEEIAKLPYYKRDLQLAKRLLKEAGYQDGFEFELDVCSRHPDWIPAAEMLKSNLAEVGINAKLVQKDLGDILHRWRKGSAQIQVLAGSSWYPTPEGYIATHYHSKSKSNYFGYKNEELDKLLDKSRRTLDTKRRIEIWKRIQYIFAEDVPTLYPYANVARNEVVANYVKDYHFMPNLSRVYLREAWLDK